MKKVTAICVYKNNSIYNLTVMDKDGVSTTLVQYELDGVKPYNYVTFHDMYNTILRLVKLNGFKIGFWEGFNAKWYDISFICLDTPTKIEKFGYR